MSKHFTPQRWLARIGTAASKRNVQILRHNLTKTSLAALVSVLALVVLFQKFSPSEARAEDTERIDFTSQGADSTVNVQTASTSPILVGAGDISSCSNDNDLKTAQLIKSIFATGATGKVVTLGDNAYDSGTSTEFTKCFGPTWGTFGNLIAPAVGNHEYQTSGASGYFNYFGSRAGNPQKGYYSYNLGAWHIVVINSNCSKVGGCQVGSPQERWLRADLAANRRTCTLAYWHHPLFSSGEHGNSTSMAPIWKALYDYHADVVLSGHDHDYERFAPQTSTGALDKTYGIREFVVGTGGRSHYPISKVKPNSLVRNSTTYGVLKLTLNPTSYGFQFIPIQGQTFTDKGVFACSS